MEIQGKLALVTGGSSGIGLAIAKELAAGGAKVAILARRPDQLEAAKKEIEAASTHPDRAVLTLQADIAQVMPVTTALRNFCAEYGVPDLLVNNAGITEPGRVEELEIEVFRRMMDVNYFGMVHTTKAILPEMLKRGSGYIVNVSSFVGFLASYGYSAYAGSKFAIRGFTDVLRAEMKPRGIKVSIVFPPDTNTPQLEYEHSRAPELMIEINKTAGRLEPVQVAREVIKGIRRERYVILPGSETKFAWFVSRFLGNLEYFLMDTIVGGAMKSVAKQKMQKK